MTDFAAVFRQALEEGDVDRMLRAWRQVGAHLPQPRTREDAIVLMHRARTETASISFKARAWSHAWLLERGLPSGLPDELRPRAQRIYPVVAEGVGFAVRTGRPETAPLKPILERAVSETILDLYANGDRDPALIRRRILETRDKIRRQA